jgi:hypothetical protein
MGKKGPPLAEGDDMVLFCRHLPAKQKNLCALYVSVVRIPLTGVLGYALCAQISILMLNL